MSEVIWETFDGLFKTLYRQGERVEQLERRVIDLEQRLQEPHDAARIYAHTVQPSASRIEAVEDDYQVERAA